MLLKKLALFISLFAWILLTGCNIQPGEATSANTLFFDDFSNSKSGWSLSNNELGSLGYTGNSYHIAINQPDTFLMSNPGKNFPGDVSVTVDVRIVSGSNNNYYGILCHYIDPDDYYLFLVTGDGYTGIVKRRSGLETLISPGGKFLKMDGIKDGKGTNQLRTDCIGEQLTLYANGKQVSLAYDHSLSGGDVGLAARTGRLEGGVEVRFDNFTVYNPVEPGPAGG
jgi:hypothetical protein